MFRPSIYFFAIASFLYGCSSNVNNPEVAYVKDPMNPNRKISKQSAERIGKLKIFSKGSKPKENDFVINKYLWDSCIDVLSDIPAQHINPNIGIYETEYVKSKDKYIKIRCRIKGKKIQSNNLDVTIFEKDKETEVLETRKDKAIKSQILLRARELKANNV